MRHLEVRYNGTLRVTLKEIIAGSMVLFGIASSYWGIVNKIDRIAGQQKELKTAQLSMTLTQQTMREIQDQTRIDLACLMAKFQMHTEEKHR